MDLSVVISPPTIENTIFLSSYNTDESNPTKKDTDGDTLNDGSDTEPTIYNVCIKNATDKKITFNDGKVWNVFGIDIYKFSDQAWSIIDGTVTDPIVPPDEVGSYMDILAKNKKLSFNNDQLAMIYLYDSNGLRSYLDSKSQSQISKIFKLITGRSPKYYKHTIGDEWKEVDKPSDKKWYDIFTSIYCETEGVLTTCRKTDFVDFLYKSLPTLISVGSMVYSGAIIISELELICTGINIMGLRKAYDTYKYCGSSGLASSIYVASKGKIDYGVDATLAASYWQQGKMYPNSDKWKMTKLKKGDIVYSGYPGPGNFYTTEETMRNCGTDAPKIFESLQVGTSEQNPNYRQYMIKYVVTKDIDVATSIVESNPQWGKGGAIQYFLKDNDWKTLLKEVDKIELTNRVPKAQYQYQSVEKALGYN